MSKDDLKQNTTIRHSLVDAMNDLAKLSYQVNDPVQIEVLKTQYDQLYTLFNHVIWTDMQAAFNSKEYKDAVNGLNKLTQEARQAADEINHTAKVIQTTANVIGKISQVFVFLASLGVKVG
jgi:hypothetical protein